MRRRRDEELYGAFDEQEDELSLEAILAEYGKGGRQPVLEEPSEGPPSQPEPVPEPESIPEPEPVQKEERVPGPEYESPAPDRVALKDIMSQTVDAVLEDEDDGVIAQPVPLRERLAAVLERFHRPAAEQKRRPAFQDTEQLFDEPEEEPEPEEPPEPEPLPEDVLREAKRRCSRLRGGLIWGMLPALALVAAAVLQELEKLPSAWLDESLLRCATLGAGLLLTALACMPVWKQAASLLREGKAGCELCAAVAVLTQLICCVCGVVTGSTRATPYAAAGALLILACQWGLYLEASALRNAYHLLVLTGTVPYVASVTAAGVCRQQGTAEGFYRLCSKPDPARRWQNYALPLVLATAAVLSGVVCFSGGNMSDFPWVLTALTTAGAGLGIPLSGALPMYYLSRRLSRSGCAAAGYAGAKAVSRPRRLVLTDDDLFPAGTVTLNGYKVFGEERSRAVSYAASVARAAGSSLTPLLERQLTAEGGFHLPVEWVNYCEEGGVEANIRGETVLMGVLYEKAQGGPAPGYEAVYRCVSGGRRGADSGVCREISALPQRGMGPADAEAVSHRAGAGRAKRQRDTGADQTEIRRGRQAGVSGRVHAAGAGPAGGAAGRAALRSHLPGGAHAAGGVCGREPPGGEGCTDRHHP